jgi:hypothetical protein
MVKFGQNKRQVLIVPLNCDPEWIKSKLGIKEPRPAIFISGGAAAMSQQDIEKTQKIMTDGVARFAEERQLVVIDGGTDSGVMGMVGKARKERGYTFPLIGCAPLGKVEFPGYVNPAKEGSLDDGHSHFVLVNGKEWGDESEMIVKLTHSVSGVGGKLGLGILINGGKISRQDVYLATTKDLSLPILVMEGSGRFADELASATKTGQTNERMLRAIILRGDIQLINTDEGPDGVYQRLRQHFGT